MAAVVDDYSMLTLDELKSQLQTVMTEIGAARVRELYAGHKPSPGIEVRYLKLYEAMKKWGLGRACLLAESNGPTIKPVARLRGQQQHPNALTFAATAFILPSYPVRVPRNGGDH